MCDVTVSANKKKLNVQLCGFWTNDISRWVELTCTVEINKMYCCLSQLWWVRQNILFTLEITFISLIYHISTPCTREHLSDFKLSFIQLLKCSVSEIIIALMIAPISFDLYTSLKLKGRRGNRLFKEQSGKCMFMALQSIFWSLKALTSFVLLF